MKIERDHCSAIGMSKHAKERATRRGVSLAVVRLIFDHADRECPVGGGCRSILITRDHAQCLLAEGFARDMLERARRVALVVANDNQVVTVIRPRGCRGRRYTRYNGAYHHDWR